MINKITLVILFFLFSFIASAQEVVHEDLPETKLVLDKTYTVVLGEEVLENDDRTRPSKPKIIHFEKVTQGSEISIKAIFEDETHKHGFLMKMDEVEDDENYIEHYEYIGDDDNVMYITMTYYRSKMLVDQKEMDFNIQMEGYWGKKTYNLYLNTNHKLLKSSSANGLPSLDDLSSLSKKNKQTSPTNKSSNIVKLESTSDNPLYKIEIDNKSKLTINSSGTDILNLKIKPFGEEYKDGMQVYNFMVLDNSRYKVLGIFDMTELSRSERIKALGITSPALITIGGGSEKAITVAAKFVSSRFSKVKNNKMIHQELTSLFESMENNFSDQKRAGKEIKRSDEVKKAASINGFQIKTYKSEMELGYLEEHVIYEIKEETYYHASILSYQESQIIQIIQAIESYPSSEAYNISRLDEGNSDRNYIIKKANKTKGFIRFFKKEEERWSFELFKAIDDDKMKSLLQTAAKQIENNDDFFKGKKTHEDIFEAKKSLYGSFSIYIYHGKGGREWQNIFPTYPFEALKYQVKNMDFSLSGWSRETAEDPELYFINFSKGASMIGIFVSYKSDSSTPMVGVTYLPN